MSDEKDNARDSHELVKFNEGSWDLDLQDLTVEVLEQRLELAIATMHVNPDDCAGAFGCESAFGCGAFGCGTFC